MNLFVRTLFIILLLVSCSKKKSSPNSIPIQQPNVNNPAPPPPTIGQINDQRGSGDSDILHYDRVELIPSYWNFGKLEVEKDSETKKFEIIMESQKLSGGLVQLQIGEKYNQFSIENDQCSGRKLKFHEKCSFYIKVGPLEEGQISGKLSFTVDGKEVDIIPPLILAEGIVKEDLSLPQIQVIVDTEEDQNQVDFGNVQIGEESSESVALKVKVLSKTLNFKTVNFQIINEHNSDDNSFLIDDRNCQKLFGPNDRECILKIKAFPLGPKEGYRIGQLKAIKQNGTSIRLSPVQFIVKAYKDILHDEYEIFVDSADNSGLDFGEIFVGEEGKTKNFILKHHELRFNRKKVTLKLEKETPSFLLNPGTCQGSIISDGQTCHFSITAKATNGNPNSNSLVVLFNGTPYNYKGGVFTFQGKRKGAAQPEELGNKFNKENHVDPNIISDSDDKNYVLSLVEAFRAKGNPSRCDSITNSSRENICKQVYQSYSSDCNNNLCEDIQDAFFKKCKPDHEDCSQLKDIFHFETDCSYVDEEFHHLCTAYRYAHIEGFDLNWAKRFTQLAQEKIPGIIDDNFTEEQKLFYQYLSKLKRDEIHKENQNNLNFKNHLINLRINFPSLMSSYFLFEDIVLTLPLTKNQQRWAGSLIPNMLEDNQTVGYEWELKRIKWLLDPVQNNSMANVDLLFKSYFKSLNRQSWYLSKWESYITKYFKKYLPNLNVDYTKSADEIMKIALDNQLDKKVRQDGEHFYYPFYDTYGWSAIQSQKDDNPYKIPWIDMTFETRYYSSFNPFMEIVTGPLKLSGEPANQTNAKNKIISLISHICNQQEGKTPSELMKSIATDNNLQGLNWTNNIEKMKRVKGNLNDEDEKQLGQLENLDSYKLACRLNNGQWNNGLKNPNGNNGFLEGGSHVQSNLLVLLQQFFTTPLLIQTLGNDFFYDSFTMYKTARKITKQFYTELMKRKENYNQIIDPRNQALGVFTFSVYQFLIRATFNTFHKYWTQDAKDSHLGKNNYPQLLKMSLLDLPRLPQLSSIYNERNNILSLMWLLKGLKKEDAPDYLTENIKANLRHHQTAMGPNIVGKITFNNLNNEGLKIKIEDIFEEAYNKFLDPLTSGFTHYLYKDDIKTRYPDDQLSGNTIKAYGNNVQYSNKIAGSRELIELSKYITAKSYKEDNDKRKSGGVVIETRWDYNLFNHIQFYRYAY